jgi:glycosyltransferase involved in cell wall biosynthesis
VNPVVLVVGDAAAPTGFSRVTSSIMTRLNDRYGFHQLGINYMSGPPGSTPEQLNRIYNACDVGINTSEAESWGLTAFEHAATGAAQIVPGHTGTREIWDGAAEMLEPKLQLTSPGSLTAIELIDPQTVAVTLERLYRNPELLQKRSLAAYQRATQPRYSWDSVAESFDQILADLAEQHRPYPRLHPVPHRATTLTGGF